MSKEIVDELKKSIEDYVRLVYGGTLEDQLLPHKPLLPKQQVVIKEINFKAAQNKANRL